MQRLNREVNAKVSTNTAPCDAPCHARAMHRILGYGVQMRSMVNHRNTSSGSRGGAGRRAAGARAGAGRRRQAGPRRRRGPARTRAQAGEMALHSGPVWPQHPYLAHPALPRARLESNRRAPTHPGVRPRPLRRLRACQGAPKAFSINGFPRATQRRASCLFNATCVSPSISPTTRPRPANRRTGGLQCMHLMRHMHTS